MALTIKITETARDAEELAHLLRHVADLVERGCWMGHYPDWELEGETEERRDCSECGCALDEDEEGIEPENSPGILCDSCAKKWSGD